MSEISKEKLDEIIGDFRNAGPWAGTIAERKAKFENCFYRLCEAAGLDQDGWRVEFEIPNRFSEWTSSGSSHANYMEKKMVLRGRLSVITLFHEFGHAYFGVEGGNLELAQIEAQDFAKRLFQEYFPDKFARLRTNPETGLLEKGE